MGDFRPTGRLWAIFPIDPLPEARPPGAMNEKNGSIWAGSCQRRWRFHLWRGARSLESGDLCGARRHFAAAYREAPEEALVCLAWGRELQKAGDLVTAERLLRRAWETDPKLDTAALHLARLLGLYLNRPEEAQAILTHVSGQSGESAPLLLLAAELQLKDCCGHEAAKALLERALALGAHEEEVRLCFAKAYNAEGIARSQAGEHHQALFALKRATDLDPDWSGPWVNRGAILERIGQVSRAQREYRRALRIEPANPVALFNLAESLRRQGDRREAERLFRRLLKLKPGYPGGERGLHQVLKGAFPEIEEHPEPG